MQHHGVTTRIHANRRAFPQNVRGRQRRPVAHNLMLRKRRGGETPAEPAQQEGTQREKENRVFDGDNHNRLLEFDASAKGRLTSIYPELPKDVQDRMETVKAARVW